MSESDFVKALRIAKGVLEQYKIDQPKWWKRMDGTPILNDVAVRMAQAFLPEGYSFADLGEAEESIENLERQVRQLREALSGLLADIEDYQTINNLGGHNNQTQVNARAALAATEPKEKA